MWATARKSSSASAIVTFLAAYWANFMTATDAIA